MSAKPAYDLDALYPDDPPRSPRRADVVILHEFGTGVTNRRGAASVVRNSDNQAGQSRTHSAWLALRIMLMVLGGVVSIAYVAALPRVLQFAAIGVAALTFILLYAMIRQHGR